MHAVIDTGAQQLLVRSGDTIQLEGKGREVGEEVRFDRVLVAGDRVGTPTLEGLSVKGKVVHVGLGPKIYVTKFKRRKNYRRRTGYRSSVYRVQITDLPEA